jgi:hypothetical protein
MLVGSAGCNGDSTVPGESFLVSGTIQNNTGSPIPANARLILAWIVSAGADYTYVFGEGSIDATAGTFEIELTEPPSGALNAGVFGVGILVVTTNPGLTAGADLSSAPMTDFIGAAGEYGVIDVADVGAASLDWLADFDAGYGVGVGQEDPGPFDIFVPTSPEGVVLIIDDIDNIEFVNWT